ncbi:MAG: tRNA (5-methylaminomethyl-2-thiouridine)(34)-methyltransferase MnmD [Bacteroidota bacterium]
MRIYTPPKEMLEANELILTSDGSHSLRSRRFGVEYHSIHGAIQESRHVFIEAGLRPYLDAGQPEIHVLEMGFGTGLNALLVRQIATAHPDVRFSYDTYEQFPVVPTEVAALNYPQELDVPTATFFDLHDSGWGVLHQLDANFSFRKNLADFITVEERPYEKGSVDVIFYDAFAPNSQPELWTQDAFAVSYAALRPGGALVTYCAKGQVKRDLRAVGFTVEALPGPPGKREMLRGTWAPETAP